MRYEVYDCHCNYIGDNIGGNNNGKLRVLFMLNLDELKFQIGNVAYSHGDSASRVNGYGKEIITEHQIHQFMDVVEEGNIEWVKNTISLAVSRIEHILYNWTWNKLKDHLSLDNIPKHKHEYIFELKVPQGFSDTTAWYILNLAQKFIVATVLEEWASITFPGGMETWSRMVQSTSVELEKAFRINNGPAYIKSCWI